MFSSLQVAFLISLMTTVVTVAAFPQPLGTSKAAGLLALASASRLASGFTNLPPALGPARVLTVPITALAGKPDDELETLLQVMKPDAALHIINGRLSGDHPSWEGENEGGAKKMWTTEGLRLIGEYIDDMESVKYGGGARLFSGAAFSMAPIDGEAANKLALSLQKVNTDLNGLERLWPILMRLSLLKMLASQKRNVGFEV
jgi:hypothetical protein